VRRMKKKSRKTQSQKSAEPTPDMLQEPGAAYGEVSSQPNTSRSESGEQREIRYASSAEVRAASDKVFKIHRDLLRRLAQ